MAIHESEKTNNIAPIKTNQNEVLLTAFLLFSAIIAIATITNA